MLDEGPENQRVSVSEIFGPVIQGEGPMTGLPTVFLRTGSCDFRCSWCDTLYAVEAKYAAEWKKLRVKDILFKLLERLPHNRHLGHVTISGGNPALWELGWLVTQLRERGVRVGVETQGSVHKDWLRYVDQLVISPKPPSAGRETNYSPESPFDRMVMYPNAFIKVVIFGDEDFEYAENIHMRYSRIPMFLQVGTDFSVDTSDDLIEKLRRLQKKVLSKPNMMDTRTMVQQHYLLHGHKRGI